MQIVDWFEAQILKVIKTRMESRKRDNKAPEHKVNGRQSD